MRRSIWEWIVRMDDRISDVMLALVAAGTVLLSSLLACV
jgi:hypothetical protein